MSPITPTRTIDPAGRREKHVLAISGSLRRGSTNSALIRAAVELAGPGTTVEVLEGLASLPHYDADIEQIDGTPASVVELRRRVGDADALLFATPEYNGSVPGALKNAIDWLSRPRGDAALAGKPVTVIGASPGQYGALWAQADLKRILGIAGARTVGDELPVARVGELLDEAGELEDEVTRERIAARLAQLTDETLAHAAAA